jgi:hypothetical protein
MRYFIIWLICSFKLLHKFQKQSDDPCPLLAFILLSATETIHEDRLAMENQKVHLSSLINFLQEFSRHRMAFQWHGIW